MSEVAECLERLEAANVDIVLHFKVLYADFVNLTSRYDDAMKRIQDLEAELEYLRREVNRG